MAAAKKPALEPDPRVAFGTPEDVVREKRGYTGAFLKPVLARGSGRGKSKKRVEAAECSPILALRHCNPCANIALEFVEGVANDQSSGHTVSGGATL